MDNSKRTIFFVSDGTGITAKTLAHSLLTQFDDVSFNPPVTFPYVNSEAEAQKIVRRINDIASQCVYRPIVFATLIDPALRHIVSTSNAMFLDFFGAFIAPLELELQIKSSHAVGLSHSIQENKTAYDTRMDAINFALQHDDGASVQRYANADVVLVGASRSGKTPTCVYLAMQFGIAAANYPLTEDDVEDMQLPTILRPYKKKLFGLTIKPERLQQIRQERRPNSRYASLTQCQIEVQKIEALYRRLQLPYAETTKMSVEEIATMVTQKMGLEKIF